MPKWIDTIRGRVKRGGWRSETTELLAQCRETLAAVLVRVGALQVSLTRVERELGILTVSERGQIMALADILAKVRESRTVEDSAAILLSDLKIKLDEAIAELRAALGEAGDLRMLETISAELDANKAALGAAIVANTPSAEGGGTPEPEPEPAPE